MASIFEGADKLGGPLTVRERFQRVMHYQKVDRIPFFEFGYWDTTLPRWHGEGLPKEIDDQGKAYAYFGIENWGGCGGGVGLLGNVYEPKVLEQGENYTIHRDNVGAVKKEVRDGIRTIPHYLEYGLKNRDDWEKFKACLQPDLSQRVPPQFYDNVPAINASTNPISAPIGSLIGWPRNWMGFENIAVLAYDDPDLLDDMVETICVVVCAVLEEVCQYVQVDFGAGWEDICFNSGPIVSPWIFDKFIVPRYARITDVLKRHGCDISWTDCDGNVTPILDQFLRGGINCMFPAEVKGGSDPVLMREQCGKDLRIVGGVDKLVLQEGPAEIEKELERIRPVVEEGGFIPTVDHRVPSSVSLENYKFYLKTKRQMFNAGSREPQYAE